MRNVLVCLWIQCLSASIGQSTHGPTVFTYRTALSLMWKDSYWGVCPLMCVFVCAWLLQRRCPLKRTREAAVIFTSNYTPGTPLLCVRVCTRVYTITHFYNLCVRLFDCVCACVHTLCVCVRVCIPRKALGLQAAWWQCRWDNIWHVSDWVSVSMHGCVRVCLCVRGSVHLGSPLIGRGSLCSLWHTGEPAGRWRETESSEACLPSASLTSTNSFTAI